MAASPRIGPGHDPAQDWNPTAYATNARFVADLAGDVVALLAVRPGERVLDLGCGDGVLTARLAAIGASVVGVDASAALVQAARARGVDAREMNGHQLSFVDKFDAVFSNAALHWMPDHAAVMRGVYRAIRKGGRFVAEFGGRGNVATIIAAIDQVLTARGFPGLEGHPWTFPSSDEFAALLVRHGFSVQTIALQARPTRLPGDVGGWLDTFADAFLRLLPPAERSAARDAIVERLRPQIRDREGVWWADYVRLRFAAVKM